MTHLKDKLIQALASFLGGFVVSLPTIQTMDYWTKLGQMISVYTFLGIGLVKFIQWIIDKRRKAPEQ